MYKFINYFPLRSGHEISRRSKITRTLRMGDLKVFFNFRQCRHTFRVIKGKFRDEI